MNFVLGVAMSSVLGAAASQPADVGQGVVVSPRITAEGQADYTDLGRFAAFFKDQGLAGQDLAIALWKQLCGTETGIYHFNVIFEGRETEYALGNIRDPLKILNVYNFGFCGILGPVLDGVFQGAGFEARSFGVPGWNHCTTEVYYDNSWHYLDIDVRGALLRADGVVASVQEARANQELWTNPPRKIEPFFPKDRDKAAVFAAYAKEDVSNQYRWFTRGWTTDHVLRPGESLTRWWRNQGGRWHHLPDYTDWMRKLLEQPPRGIKPNHADFSIWGVGSALFVYEPDLTDKTRDVELGVWSMSNVRSSPAGLTPVSAGQGTLVFEVLSPYIVAPIMDDLDELDNFALNRDAATVMVDATVPVLAEVSTDGGRSWVSLGPLPNKARCDLTRWVRGTYRYLIRLILDGQPEQAVLKALQLRTWGQVAPISIPRLKSGHNVLHLAVNDPRNRATRLVPVLPDLGHRPDVEKYGIQIEGTYEPENFQQRVRGTATLAVEAPPGELIEWLSLGGMFQAYQHEQAARTANRIELATGPEGPFKPVYDARGTVPDWNDHWHYAMDVDVVLEEPAPRVWVRYTGDPGCNAIRIYAHCRDPRPVNTGLVRVGHQYCVGDQLLIKSFDVPAAGGSYTIDCQAAPTNVSLKLEVPHAVRAAGP